MEYDRGRRMGALGMAVAAFGLVFAYMSSLHGREIGVENAIAFAVWVVVFAAVAVLLEWFAKWIVLLALALTGYMWWTGSPTFERYAADATETRNALCRDAAGAFPEAPVSDYLCP